MPDISGSLRGVPKRYEAGGHELAGAVDRGSDPKKQMGGGTRAKLSPAQILRGFLRCIPIKNYFSDFSLALFGQKPAKFYNRIQIR